MTRYGAALDRLGISAEGRAFYDVHVEADAVHEVVASHRLAGGLAAAEPELACDIIFGAQAIILVEDRFARHVLGRWGAGRSSLLEVPPTATAYPGG